MAKLVGVIRSDEYPFERRQLPLQLDDTLSMVIQFEDTCLGCTEEALKQNELEYFVQKFHMLSSDDIAVALMVTSREMYSVLSQMVPCVGCRRSVERLFGQLVESGHPVLEPLIVTPNSVLSIKREYLFDPRALFALFYIHGSKLNSILGAIPKSKKNKRCGLHSLDSHTHKTKTLGIWMEVWEQLSSECREEVVLIECDCLMETLESYLRKHRFCTECKSKVLRAYNILVGEVEAKQEKGYVASLYEGLRCCQGHIHVLSNTDFISHLITRAEPDLMGSRRERHAKTLDIAQEEVLTCLGIHLYERLHKIWQKLKAEEQTWQMLFYLGLEALRKNFEVALENKRGISNLELLCEELLQEEQAKEQRREQKREKKKKKKKNKKGNDSGNMDVSKRNSLEKDKENCLCDENTNLKSQMCSSCDDNHNTKKPICEPVCTCDADYSPKSKMKGVKKAINGVGNGRCNGTESPNKRTKKYPDPCPVSISACADARGNDNKGKQSPVLCRSTSYRSDCGYSSGQEGCDNCSIPSSRDGSDIACSEGVCNHDGDSVLCQELLEDTLSCDGCLNSGSPLRDAQQTTKSSYNNHVCNGNSGVERNKLSWECGKTPNKVCQFAANNSSNIGLTLLDMLEDSCSGSEDEVIGSEISEEEIRDFRAKQNMVNHQRCQLRAVLRQRFANLQMRLQPKNSAADNDKSEKN